MAQTFIPGRNGGYPCLAELPELPYPLVPPYPLLLQRCLGEEINDGYPVIMKLSNVKTGVFSKLFLGEKRVEGLYFNGSSITKAYCGGEQVFGIYYFI